MRRVLWMLAIVAMLATSVLADSNDVSFRASPLANYSDDVLLSATNVTVANGATAYLVAAGTNQDIIQRAGIFSGQLQIDGTAPLNVWVSLETILGNGTDSQFSWLEYGSASSSTTSTGANITTTGVSAPFRLSADIPGYAARIKVINYTGSNITLENGVIGRW